MTEVARVIDISDRLPVPAQTNAQVIRKEDIKIDMNLVGARCHNAAILSGRYAFRALNPGMWKAAIARTLRGAGVASKWAYGLVTAKDLDGVAAKDPKYVHAQQQARLRFAGVVAALGAAAGVYGYFQHPYYLTGATLATAGVFYGIGKKKTDAPLMKPTLPTGPLVAGVSARSMIASVNEALTELAIPAQADHAALMSWGWEIRLNSKAPIASISEGITKIETALMARPGSVTPIQDPTNSAFINLRCLIGDPLKNLGGVPGYAPLSQDFNAAFSIGKKITGEEIMIRLPGTHVAIIGASGSGKSSSFSAILDYVTACDNAIAVGGDVSGAPSLQAWGDLLRRSETTQEGIEEMLIWALDIALDRSKKLGAAARPTADSDPNAKAPSHNHVPTQEEPAVVVFLDEFPQMIGGEIGKNIMDLCRQLVRVGRKARVSVVFAAQRAKADEMGDSTIREMCQFKIMHACADKDVQQLIGSGMIAKGWAAHKLIPEAGGDINDAGKCYVWGPGHTAPDLGGIYYADEQYVWETCIARLRTQREVTLPVSTSEAVSLLDHVVAAFEEAGNPVGIRTEDLAEALQVEADDLVDGMLSYGIKTERPTLNGVQRRAYTLEAVLAAK